MIGSEMAKGERPEGDDLAVRNSSAKGEKENGTHCVPNLERFGRFITHRVMNFKSHPKVHLQFFCISAILVP
jgi:hypothetical protein